MASTPATSGAAAVSTDPLNDAFVDLGASGLRQHGGYVREEWLRDLQGWKGIRVYREMRDNDPVIGAIFFAIEMLLRGVPFRIEPGDPKMADDVAAAAFVNSCMSDLAQTWPSFMSEILTFLHFGWDVHEILYKHRRGKNNDRKLSSKYEDGLIGWSRFGGRAQETLLHWEFGEDGEAVAMVQMLPTGGPRKVVPLAKCLHFRTTSLKGNPEGRSIMRSAYLPWYYGKRLAEIEAIGVERDLTGLPIAHVPAKYLSATATAEDRATLAMFKRMVRDTTRGEQEGFVLPLAYDANNNPLFKFELLTTGGRRAFDTTGIINRYDQRKAMTVLADFILLGHEKVGSFALSGNKTDLFRIAVTAFLDVISAEFNDKAIPDLLEINGMSGSVRMAHGDIADSDLDAMSNYVERLTRAGILTPDDELEAHMREEGGLPVSADIGSRTVNDGSDAADQGAGTRDAPQNAPEAVGAA